MHQQASLRANQLDIPHTRQVIHLDDQVDNLVDSQQDYQLDNLQDGPVVTQVGLQGSQLVVQVVNQQEVQVNHQANLLDNQLIIRVSIRQVNQQ